MQHFYHFHPKENTFPGFGKRHAHFGIVSTVRGTRSATKDAMPFGEASLKILNTYHDVSDMYFTNLIREPHAFGKKPYVKFIREYLPTLIKELKFIFEQEGEPARILVMGSVLAQHLCPGFKDLNADRGSFFFNPDFNAYVVPTYHFGAVAKSPRMKEWMKRDLNRFFLLPNPVKPEYTVFNMESTGWRPESDSNLFLDIETVEATLEDSALNVETAKIESIGMLNANSKVHIVEHPTQKQLAQLHAYIVKNNITVVGHNLSFDLAMLSWREGKLWDDVKVKDTMLMAYVLGHTNKSLKHLATFLTDRSGSRGFGGTQDLNYLAEDVLATEELYNYFKPLVENIYAYPLLNSLVPKFIGMRQTGVAIDNTLFDDILPQMEKDVAGLLDKLQKVYTFGEKINWNSSQQVAPVLVKNGVPLYEKTPTGMLSVSAPILDGLRDSHEIVNDLLTHREQEKTLTFLRSYQGFMQYDGRLHPQLMLDGAKTGRLSCREPNLQQVPAKGIIKTVFISQFERGKLGLVDLAQAELCIAALLSSDIEFVNALKKQDVHRYIASLIYNISVDEVTPFQRSKAKTIGFGLLYGGGARGLAARLGINEEEVVHVTNIFYNQFPILMSWIEYQKRIGVHDRQSVTPFGRIRDFRDILRFEGVSSVERKAVNTPVQGTASDVMLIILNKLYELCKEHGLQSRPILGVHDSTIIDIYPGEEEQVAAFVGEAFEMVEGSPLGMMEMWEHLPIEGELSIGDTWASVENVSEYFSPNRMFKVSSHAPVEEIDKSHYEG